jgi:hypothetical protein
MKALLKILFCFLLLIQICFAQWPQDSTSKINVCTAPSDQQFPAMVSDGEGGSIIVWQDLRNNNIPNIYAQRIDSSGIARWATNGILISSIERSRHPKLINDGFGGAIITWFDFRNGWPNSSVQAQRVNGNGEILWQTNGVTLANAANSWAYPEIIGYGSEGAIVTWIGVNGEIYAMKIDTAGNLLWPADSVMLAPTGGLPQIAHDDSGGAIVCWFDYDFSQPITSTNVFAQRVDSEGNVRWSPTGVPICLAPDYQHQPDLVSDGAGGAIISWLDGRSDSANYIYAQRIDSQGDTCWLADGIQISNTKGYYRPIIAADGNGGMIITWMGGTSEDVYVQHIDTSGTILWPGDIRVSHNTDPHIPGIISDGTDGAIIFWENQTDNKIKAQHISGDGILSFPVYGKTVATDIGSGGWYAASTDGTGKVIFAWEETQSYNINIYSHRIIVPGFISDVLDEQLEHSFLEFFVSQNYPNPFNPSTAISFALPKASTVELKIFNLLGQEVATLLNEEKTSGIYQVEFDASTLPSGVYFYRLQAGDFVQTKKMILLR